MVLLCVDDLLAMEVTNSHHVLLYKLKNFDSYRLEDDPCPNSSSWDLLSKNENEASNENDEKGDKNAKGRMHDSSGQDGQKSGSGEDTNKDSF